MSGTWAWHTYSARTGARTGTLALTAWTHEDRLNDSGSWAATLAPPETADAARTALLLTEESTSTVAPFRDGAPLGFTGYIGPGGQRRPSLAGGNLLSTLDLRVLDNGREYIAVDQFALAADLIQIVQATNGAEIDTTLVGTSGVLRSQTWAIKDMKNVGEALRQAAAQVDGFDFDIRTEVDTGGVIRRLRCWHPRRGRAYVDGASPVFVAGGNVIHVPEVAGDIEARTEVIALGAETDADTQDRLKTETVFLTDAEVYRILNVYDPSYGGELHKVRSDAVLDLPEVDDLPILGDYVAGYADKVARREGIAEIVLDVDPDDAAWPWGSWDLGDDCRVVIPTDAGIWWPDGYNEVRRIVAHRWSVDAAGETLQIVTGPTLL